VRLLGLERRCQPCRLDGRCGRDLSLPVGHLTLLIGTAACSSCSARTRRADMRAGGE
jgi:hypothetical protein